jgi:hypothetical protein
MSKYEYKGYHASITDELHVLKDRVRNLVRYWKEDANNSRSHWLTDGEWKESVLRTMLRRHIPTEVFIGRGFILFQEFSSTQIDIVILKPSKPTVFKDGELVVVTPDVPRALIEVKTRLDDPGVLEDAVTKLCEIGALCKNAVDTHPWLGLFVYDAACDDNPTHDKLQNASIRALNAACNAFKKTGIPINCICYGRTLFVRYWPRGEWKEPDTDEEKMRASWRSYRLVNLAPAYFLGNVIDEVCAVDNRKSSFAWFTYHQGKGPYRLAETLENECEPLADAEAIHESTRHGDD